MKNQSKNQLNTQTENKSFNELMVSIFESELILKESDLENLSNSVGFIKDNFLTVPMYRSLPIKLYAILNNAEHPTNESKYYQCKIEAEVHANELVRDLHELELHKLKIEKMNFNLKKMDETLKDVRDESKIQEILFDKKEQQIILSLASFEFMQLQKRIKHRIEEVKDWKNISDTIEQSGLKTKDFNVILKESLELRWKKQILDPKLSESDKKMLQIKIDSITKSN